MEKITSESNKKIKNIKKLIDNPRYRKKQGLFVVEGERIVEEAIKREAAVEIFVDEENNPIFFNKSEDGFENFKNIEKSDNFKLDNLNNYKALENSHRFDLSNISVPVTVVSGNIFKELSNTINSQGIIALCKIPDGFDLSKYLSENLSENNPAKPPLLLLLDGIQDPGNLGTIIRSSLGADVEALILSKNSVDIFNPKVLRSTMGAVFDLDFCYVDFLPEVIDMLKSNGFNIYATLPDESNVYYDCDYNLPTAIIIGNEASVKKILIYLRIV
ncbi:MAG: RNA methyltransferase [Lachnospiraceae bacterium]|nr:RNA methyltransferase [Lachnospiraceae bacterium]